MKQNRRVLMEENEEVTRAAAALWDAFGTCERGTMIPYAAMEPVIHASPQRGQGKQILEKFRTRLRVERDVITRCVIGVGLELLTNHDVAARVPAERAKKAYRQCGKMLKETAAAVASAELSDHERVTLAMTRDTVRAIRWGAGRAKRAHEKAMEATPTNPVRPASLKPATIG